jgi:predicted ATPase/transcriptional regulator with XRE-family HTH domain
MPRTSAITPEKFTTFGELLRFLRRKADLTQRELSIAVAYSESQISRLEQNERAPEEATLAARFVPALYIEDEPQWVARLLELGATTHSHAPEADAPQPIAEAKPTPQNLPIQLTSFIGREKEITEIKRLLAGKKGESEGSVRLLTLTGHGGCGKTRLGIETASASLPHFPDGVFFVALAPLSDPVLVPQTIATTLGLIEQASHSPVNTLTDFLQAKRALLILDNCEHLIHACAQLAETLLQTCPNLHIFTTSREALGIAGETLYLVPPLTTPDPDSLHETLDTLRRYEAVQLFIERAQTVISDFSMTRDNAPAIAQVCHYLDGIPLALELAAARVKVLRVEQIASRLNDRFHLLTSGARTALPRHQTLQAMIDWSHDLLSESERVLLRRLSIFAGGWTLEAAESVCGDDGIETHMILDLLMQLLNKSLILAERKQGQETRYHMLETIRQYAREKSWAMGEGERMRHQHASFFIKLAEEAKPELRGSNQHIWLERLDAEKDNLRVVLNLLVENNIEAGARLAGSLFWFWHTYCYWSEGRAWYDRLLKSGIDPYGQTPLITAMKAQVLCEAGWLALADMDTNQARILSEEGLALYRELGDKTGIAIALNTLGWAAYYLSNYSEARSLAEESLTLSREIGNKFKIADVLNLLGNIARAQGYYASAVEFYKESLKWARELGDKATIAYSLGVWGYLAWSQGDLEQAAILTEESLQLSREVRLDWSSAETLITLGDIARARGEYEKASKLYDECNAIWDQLGQRHEMAYLLWSRGWLARLQSNHQQAVKFFNEGLRLWQEVGDKRHIAECLVGLAGVNVDLGQAEIAARLMGTAEAIREVTNSPLPPVDRTNYDRDFAIIRSQLGETNFIKAWAEGRAMTMEQAITEATR